MERPSRSTNTAIKKAPAENDVIRRTAGVHFHLIRRIMMSNEIKAGDTVMLKSGGPIMTVSQIGDLYGTTTAWCDWFDSKKQANATFPLTSLKPA